MRSASTFFVRSVVASLCASSVGRRTSGCQTRIFRECPFPNDKTPSLLPVLACNQLADYHSQFEMCRNHDRRSKIERTPSPPSTITLHHVRRTWLPLRSSVSEEHISFPPFLSLLVFRVILSVFLDWIGLDRIGSDWIGWVWMGCVQLKSWLSVLCFLGWELDQLDNRPDGGEGANTNTNTNTNT